MKTLKLLFWLLSILIITPVLWNTVLSLTQTDITNHINKWYILSNSYIDYNKCNQDVEKYNIDFPRYKRSECFLNNTNYNYFICDWVLDCKIESTNRTSINTTSSTTLNNTQTSQTRQTVTNQDKLDKFLEKIWNMRKEMNAEQYERLLNQLEKQLLTLNDKFKSNDKIIWMINYLETWIQWIKKEFVENKDVEDFFCLLIGNCENISLWTPKIYISNTSRNDVSPATLNWVWDVSRTTYIILDWVNRSNPPKWCTQPVWATWCNNLANYRDYLTTDWVSDTRIATIAPANAFPAWRYESFILQDWKIIKVWTWELRSMSPTYRWDCWFVTWSVSPPANQCSANNVWEVRQVQWAPNGCKCIKN